MPSGKKREIQPVFKRLLAMFETYSDLARAAGTTPQFVDYWLRVGHVPANWCLAASNASGGKIPLTELAAEAARMAEKRKQRRQAMREIRAKFEAAGENHGG